MAGNVADPQVYPFIPKSNAHLKAGQFWAIPLSDGRFACGRVLRAAEPGQGKRTMFVAGLVDWVGSEPPTAESIAGAKLADSGNAHIRTIPAAGGGVLGYRDLDADGIVVPRDTTNWWSLSFPALRAEHLFVAGNPPPRWGIRDVTSPLTADMLSPFPEPEGVVQFSTMLTDADFVTLADWLRSYPQLRLRAYGSYDGSITKLEFLRFFPTIRNFAADSMYHSLESLDGLRHLSDDLETLVIGATKRKLDLTILDRFRNLKELVLEGQVKGIGVISKLTSLEDLQLRSITLPDLSLLLPLSGLLALEIKLGGTKDLGLLPRIGTLNYLELWMIKGLTDISAVGRLPHLRYLFLQALRQVEALPDLSMDTELRRVHVETMKGLRDLRPLTTAPALEQLSLVDMRHLQVEDLRCLVGLPHLKGVDPGLGSVRKYEAARALLGLPHTTSLRGGWREV